MGLAIQFIVAFSAFAVAYGLHTLKEWAEPTARALAFPLSLGWPLGLFIALYTWWVLNFDQKRSLSGGGRLKNGAISHGAAAAKRGDYAAALKLWMPLAERGNPHAQYDIGIMYLNGDGVAKDSIEAASWLRRAADQGHASAQHTLGNLYATGNGGSKDESEAAHWYHLAANKGHAGAQYSLGRMYSDGVGVPQDDVMAHMWFSLAAAQGDANAMGELDRVNARMVPDQIAAAKRLAGSMRAPESRLSYYFKQRKRESLKARDRGRKPNHHGGRRLALVLLITVGLISAGLFAVSRVPWVGQSVFPLLNYIVFGVDVRSEEEQKFYKAIYAGDVSAVARHLENGVSANSSAGFGMPPLYLAQMQNHPTVMTTLIRYGADLNVKYGPSQRTALHDAALGGRIECMKVLLAAGADPNVVNAFGRTPLNLATEAPPPLERPPNINEVITLLREYGGR